MKELKSIKIVKFPPMFWLNSYDGMVLNKYIIFVRTTLYRKNFEQNLLAVINKDSIWPADNVSFFLHELFHIVQSIKIPFWKRLFSTMSSLHLKHDRRPFEMAANKFARTYGLTPKDAYDRFEKALTE